ncbi:hypothetical protein T440DRAFT_467630, partial [Plenodomus tracheiphilus IPT5]
MTTPFTTTFGSFLTVLPRSTTTPIPMAPSSHSSTHIPSGISPTAIICIVAATILLLLSVPLIALLLRRYERKRLVEPTIKDTSTSSNSS